MAYEMLSRQRFLQHYVLKSAAADNGPRPCSGELAAKEAIKAWEVLEEDHKKNPPTFIKAYAPNNYQYHR